MVYDVVSTLNHKPRLKIKKEDKETGLNSSFRVKSQLKQVPTSKTSKSNGRSRSVDLRFSRSRSPVFKVPASSKQVRSFSNKMSQLRRREINKYDTGLSFDITTRQEFK